MSQVNISLNTNNVEVTTTENQVIINNPDNPVVQVTQPISKLIEVITPGPQGPPGDPSSLTGSFVNISVFNDFTSSYNTGSFTGSFSGIFSGSGANLFNIPASGIIGLNLSQISSGSVSASISPNRGLEINTNVIITPSSISGSSDLLLIKNGSDNGIKVNSEGVLQFLSQSSLPTAVGGGMIYSGSAFYVGID